MRMLQEKQILEGLLQRGEITMRLIDADALFNWGDKKLSDAVKYGNKDGEQQGWSYSTLMMYEVAYEIDSAPTIEPPVKRGKWVEDGGARGYVCTSCANGIHTQKTNFCPNCGADMRTEGDA